MLEANALETVHGHEFGSAGSEWFRQLTSEEVNAVAGGDFKAEVKDALGNLICQKIGICKKDAEKDVQIDVTIVINVGGVNIYMGGTTTNDENATEGETTFIATQGSGSGSQSPWWEWT